ncbi:hypothetical protein HO133_006273 [Letharia lupina]|uniref:Ankyrin repeat protein n=1 Tax=Letharia lupina TaxID=560253 RepID=A0A8H6C714_9LECA|nr:uncharacterized protein HO133_006273 [Letharia lupina]KAF6217861.1 hypothetical protein HO133_006273 [Letharia lupina]
MNATKEGNELHDLEDANLIGDLDRSHTRYSTWFARQRPAPAQELSAKTTYTLLPIALLPMINQPPPNIEPSCLPDSRRLVVHDESLIRWLLAHGADPNASSRRMGFYAALAPLEVINLLFERGGSTANGRLLNRASDPILQCSPDRGVPINDTLLEHRPGLAHRANAGAAATPFHKCGCGRKCRVGEVFSRTVAPLARIKLPFDTAVGCEQTVTAKILAQGPPLPAPRSGIRAARGWRYAFCTSGGKRSGGSPLGFRVGRLWEIKG